MKREEIIRILGETTLCTPLGQAAFAAIESLKAIEEVKEAVCDSVCKYPAMYTVEEWEAVSEEVCSNCPLGRL